MDAVVTTLRTVSLFAELPREVLARLVSEFDELEVPAGRTVFSQGDPGDALYVVVSGAVEVRGERDGPGERVAVLGPGDCLGEMALVTGDPRSATVVALSPTRLLRLDKERFRALSERHPVFLRELARVLCRRIARTSVDVAHARRAYTTVFDAILAGCEPPARRLLELLAVADRADAGVLTATLGRGRPAARGRGRRAPPGPGRPGRERGLPTSTTSSARTSGGASATRAETDGTHDLHVALATAHGAEGAWTEGARHWLAAAAVDEAAHAIRRALASGAPPPDAELEEWLDRLPEDVLLQADLGPAKASLLVRTGRRTSRARSSSARSRDTGSTAAPATASCGASAPSTRSGPVARGAVPACRSARGRQPGARRPRRLARRGRRPVAVGRRPARARGGGPRALAPAGRPRAARGPVPGRPGGRDGPLGVGQLPRLRRRPRDGHRVGAPPRGPDRDGVRRVRDEHLVPHARDPRAGRRPRPLGPALPDHARRGAPLPPDVRRADHRPPHGRHRVDGAHPVGPGAGDLHGPGGPRADGHAQVSAAQPGQRRPRAGRVHGLLPGDHALPHRDADVSARLARAAGGDPGPGVVAGVAPGRPRARGGEPRRARWRGSPGAIARPSPPAYGRPSSTPSSRCSARPRGTSGSPRSSRWPSWPDGSPSRGTASIRPGSRSEASASCSPPRCWTARPSRDRSTGRSCCSWGWPSAWPTWPPTSARTPGSRCAPAPASATSRARRPPSPPRSWSPSPSGSPCRGRRRCRS